MSKIALEPNVAGTGTFSIAAPNSNTNRTLTLPDVSGEVVLNEGSGTFKIDASGNVGIGTSSPSGARLHVDQGGDGNGIKLANSARGAAYAEWQLSGALNEGFTFIHYNGTNTNTLSYQSQDLHFWNTNNTERLRIDASGNLGLGVVPSAWGNRKAIQNGGGTDQIAHFNGAGLVSVFANNYYWDGTSNRYVNNGRAHVYSQEANGSHLWFTSPAGTAGSPITFSQAMTLDASGNLLVGTTTKGGAGGMSVRVGGFTPNVVFNRSSTTSSSFPLEFQNGGSIVGYIAYNNSSTSYVTSSDYRLKDDIQPVANAADRLLQLKPCNFAWKVDGSRTDGFLAHELQDVIPAAAHGTKDEVDADGKPVYQGIDQSKIVPLLTAALQEALADIATLKAEVAALKGASA